MTRPTEFGDAFAGCRVLVTGATGFIGWHLCAELVALGAEVHGLSRRATGARLAPGCKAWPADLEDIADVRRVFVQVKPEVVFHLASVVDGRQDQALVMDVLRANLIGSVNLALVSGEANCRRVVAAGSSEEMPSSEHGRAPSSPYAAAKAAATSYFQMFHRLYGLPVTLVRPFLTYGPRQPETKLIPYVIGRLLRGEAPQLASGRRICDFVFVSDVVRGFCLAALANGPSGQTFDLGTGVGTAVRDVIDLLTRLTGSPAQPVFGALADRVGEPESVADVERTRRDLGWEPRWSLVDGLSATVHWHREQLASTS